MSTKKTAARKTAAKKPVAKKSAASKKPVAVAKKAPVAKKSAASKKPIAASKKAAVSGRVTASAAVASRQGGDELAFGMGKTIACEIADFDARDIYTFQVQATEPSLVVAWKLNGCGDHGTIEVDPDALAEGTSLQGFSQGNVEEGDSPPFLLGRGAFAALTRGETITITQAGQACEYRPDGHEDRRILVDDGPVLVRCIHAEGSDGDLWVVDDPIWPLIARIETDGGDNYSEIVLVSAHDPAAVEAQLSKKKRRGGA